jgi:hypothetical protein
VNPAALFARALDQLEDHGERGLGAQKSWRRLDGHNQLPKIIEGVKFIDGLEITAKLKAQQPRERS